MEEILGGGKADNRSIQDIAEKHQSDVASIQNELEMGIEIEQEHTDDINVAREVAMDHLDEIPDYYTRLKEMESGAQIK